MDKEYFIELNGRKIPVSKEVYYAFKRPAWKERKRRQVRAEKELSLEAFADAGFEIPSGQALVDEIVEDKGVRVLVDPKAILFLLGTQMDFAVSKLSSGFVFNNPNQTSACGCGESVAITPVELEGESAGA
mgnify:CR=1 FL=1